MDNYYFDFSRCDSFFKGLNNPFKLGESVNYMIYFVGESCYDNYEDCINNGVLKEELIKDSLQGKDLLLTFSETSEQALLTIEKDYEITIAENTSQAVKGIFITDPSNKVFFYNINPYSVYMTNKIILRAGTILWEDNSVVE